MPVALCFFQVRLVVWLNGLLLVLVALSPAQAAASGAVCDLTVTGMDFGEYSSLATRPADFTAAVSILCTAADDRPITVAGSISLLINDTSAVPHLQSGRKKLRYQLYVDAARSVPWALGPAPISFSGVLTRHSPLRRNMTIYGRIQAGQLEPGVGYYEDVITVILNY